MRLAAAERRVYAGRFPAKGGSSTFLAFKRKCPKLP